MADDARSRFVEAMRAILVVADCANDVQGGPCPIHDAVKAACEAFADAVCGKLEAKCRQMPVESIDVRTIAMMPDQKFSAPADFFERQHAACRAAIVKEVMGE